MEEEITYTDITYNTSLLSFLHERIISSQLHKEKNYMKENKNLSYKLQISLSSTLCLVVPIYSEKFAFYRQKTKRGEAWEDRGSKRSP